MKRFRQIEALLSEAFALNLQNDAIKACDKWLEAWEQIKALFTDRIATDIYDLDKKFTWKEFPSNHMQYLEMELHNAGVDDKTYHQKRIDYCMELIQWGGEDELLINNTRIALGEAHYDLGDEQGGERIFNDWVQEDPDCGWAYSGWADCLRLHGHGQYEKAEEVLLAGYARSGLRDKKYVVEGFINLYGDMGKSDKSKEFKKIYGGLQQHAGPDDGDNEKPVQVPALKVGRNDPCPCGSGKKYKKCCLTHNL